MSAMPRHWKREQRFHEGWMLSEDYSIQAILPEESYPGAHWNIFFSYVFNSDEEALAFIKQKAESGSKHHEEVLVWLTKKKLNRAAKNP